MTYRAPVADIAFALKHAAGLKAALADGLYGDLDEETVDSVLEEAGRFASDVIAPLNRVGDKFGTPFKDGAVTITVLEGHYGSITLRNQTNLSDNLANQLLAGDPPDPRELPEGCPFVPRCSEAIPECSTAEPDLLDAGPLRRAACIRVEADG